MRHSCASKKLAYILCLSGTTPFSINSFRLAFLFALLVGLNIFFLIGTLAWFIKITKNRSFRVRRGVLQGSVLGPVLFSLFINNFPAFLPSSISCSFYAHDLAIWSSSPSFPTAVEATRGALFRLVRWSEHWCLRNFERNKNLAVCLLIYATVIILNCLCHNLIEFKNSAHII